ncbi:MAG: thiosulfate oxidation carrier complex protein SoxZ [Gammaproteobacteria bacterium]|nr:thiosulfate oxidation carrier complex protein SoxZ [Gammaproteobacteria bacterium]
MSGIKIRAKASDGEVTLKSLISHPMETGSRKDSKTGKTIPAHFIEEVTVSRNGTPAVKGLLSGGVSKNPYLSVKFKGDKGDKVTVAWTDNKGESESEETTVR